MENDLTGFLSKTQLAYIGRIFTKTRSIGKIFFSRNPFVHRLRAVFGRQVYIGREEGQNREVNQGQRVVLDLVTGLEKSGRNVTCDNFFTSISLARELAKRQMTVFGTIRKNKGELPTKLTETKSRQENTSIFAFQDSATLVSYCPKKGRVVVLLSTEHDTAKINN